MRHETLNQPNFDRALLESLTRNHRVALFKEKGERWV